MKLTKAIALAAVMAFAANAQAQESYAPEAGDFSLEMQFNPFSGEDVFTLPELKARWFFTDKDAIRIGLGFGVGTHKSTANPENADLWSKTQQGNFSLNLGYERTVYSYKRVNLYAGAGLAFELNREKETVQSEFPTGVDNEGNPITKIVSASKHNVGDSFNAFYAKAFTGIDFFVYKGLYIGAELGLKIGVKNYVSSYTKGGIVTDNNGVTSWDDDLESAKGPKSNDFELKLYAEPSFRLGWQF